MNRLKLILLAVTVCFLLRPDTVAQVSQTQSLNLDGARKVIQAAFAEAKANAAPGAVVAVVDQGGHLIALERMDGTFNAGAEIAIGKARTAVNFKKPTKFFEEIIRNGRTPMLALDDFTPLQGGVPIELNGRVVGGVGVSGAASASQDEEIAMAGSAAIARPSSQAKVSFFDKNTVDAAFARGAVLFDESDKYMVHASHRDKPGQAEVHLDDADVIYVIEGTATLVTGGDVVAPQTVAPGEIRGSEIAGGESREISRGDVIIVPARTPHWFKKVDGAINYYVVKAR